MIVYVSDFLNHHQYPLAIELFRLTHGNFRFIELMPMPDAFKQSGYPNYECSYMLIQSWKDDDSQKLAKRLIIESDVLLYGYITDFNLIRKRLNNHKLTFEVGERWLKRGMLNLLSPRLIRAQLYYHLFFFNKPLYRLNSSAYAADDMRLMLSFRNKCFKWGYFTEIDKIDVGELNIQRRMGNTIKFISVGRLIDWKRHDLIIHAANILKLQGLVFEINIYGSGPEESNLMRLIKSYNLENFVFMKGNKENATLLKEMRKHHACIFPSNKQEGWGAVVNEAMSNACPVIGSHLVGSIPFLIDDNVNGLIFPSGNYKALAQKMGTIIKNQNLRERLALNAYSTMRNEWSPQHAANNLLNLIDALTTGNSKIPDEGPGSSCQK